MAKIQELSALLADQIAAGEVVERPSSVVKELVENAIDANSTQIDIVIEEAGLKKIQVTDNGDGMDQTDALMAFKRHATSKLHAREDLFRIKTLGFRGEALPSIASVSLIVMQTATGEGEGTLVELKAGEIIDYKPTVARKGTSISVEQLFFNTPARLKFVSSLQRETANIADLINRLALSHPHITFTLVSEGNQLVKTAGNGQLQQTIAGIYSPNIARQMKWFQNENLDFRVNGFVSLPELTRSNRNYMSLFVNGRYIKNYAINQAIIDGYESKLMVGRFPIAVVNIEMDYALVDVNVHPTKQQVRISQEKELGSLIKEAISQVMNETVRIPSSLPKRFDDKGEQTHLTFETVIPPTEIVVPADHLVDTNREFVKPVHSQIWSTANESTVSYVDTASSIRDAIQKSPEKQMVKETNTAYEQESFPELHYFGQMHGTYLFAENEHGLYIVDQHAAQERIKYEYYRVAIGEMNTEQQGLLVPVVLDYPLNDYLRIKEHLPQLHELTIYLQDFGQNSFMLTEHPSWINDNVEQTVRDIVDYCLTEQNVTLAKFREDTAIMMSCKKSIKANHYLDEAQARALLVDLSTCQNPYNCPHGRPVLIHLTNTDLEKMFKRIQDR